MHLYRRAKVTHFSQNFILMHLKMPTAMCTMFNCPLAELYSQRPWLASGAGYYMRFPLCCTYHRKGKRLRYSGPELQTEHMNV